MDVVTIILTSLLAPFVLYVMTFIITTAFFSAKMRVLVRYLPKGLPDVEAR